MPNPFQVRGVYSFDVYPVALLQQSFLHASVVAILDPETAAREIDIQAFHAQIYPTLPAGTPNDATGYDYIKFKMTSGETIILGLPWINAATIQQIQAVTIDVSISNVFAADADTIRNALIQNGFNSFSLNVR